MKVEDSLGALRGHVTLRVLDDSGVCLHRYEGPNTITYLTPLIIKDLLIQDDVNISASNDHPAYEGWGFNANQAANFTPGNNAIRYLKIGTGGATPSARQQTSLSVPVACVSIASGLYPTASSVRFITQVGADIGNGLNAPINEVGLFTLGTAAFSASPQVNPAGTRMLARQVHPDVTKTEQIILEYSWTIYFT